MNASFTDELRSWHDFFMLTGGAGATLMGLVFVAVSLAGNNQRSSMAKLRTFVMPIVQHFTFVLVVSGVFVVPTHRPPTLAISILGVALISLFQILLVLHGLIVQHRVQAVTRDYWIWHFVMPIAAALMAVTSAARVFLRASWAIELLATAVLTFIVIGSRNAWMLVMWILDRRGAGPDEA